MFKKGDYIRVKPNTKLDYGEIVNNWAGEIDTVFLEDEVCMVTLDAETLDALNDDYLISCIEDEVDAFIYAIDFENMELAPRRDTDEQRVAALDRMYARMIELAEVPYSSYQELKEEWLEEFENSYFYKDLNDLLQDNASFVVGTFMDIIYNFESVTPDEWNASNVTMVCLEIVPRKITSEIELFEIYGDILICFFKFIGTKEYIENSDELIAAVEKIKHKIPIEANNPKHWGIAKSMMMSAQSAGVDLSNEEELKKYMMQQQIANLDETEQGSARIVPLKVDPFKGIGRNQKITVKYNDGRIVEDVKFKKVEADLRSGRCEVLG